jgi:putative NADH-flavin reductase
MQLERVRSESSLRLLVLGATGGVGRELLAQARSRGHRVTAFVRSPEKLTPPGEGLTVMKGDPRSVAELRQALPGHDAVISSLGSGGIGPTTLLRDCGRSTVEAMQAVGPTRLAVVSVAMLFPESGILGALLRNTLLRNVAEDAREMESAVRASGLSWTLVRPPRLTNGMHTGVIRAEDGRLPDGKGAVSRADVAHFLLDEIEHPAHLRQIVGLAG